MLLPILAACGGGAPAALPTMPLPTAAVVSKRPAAQPQVSKPTAAPAPIQPTPVTMAEKIVPIVSTTFLQRLPDDTMVEGAESTLVRMEHGLYATVKTSGLEPGNALTLWWVIFNRRENCSDGKCGPDDVFLVDKNGQFILDDQGAPQANVAARAATEVSQLTGPGAIVGQNGSARFLARLPMGDTNEAQFGPGLLDPMAAEVHLVIRAHGPASPGVVPEQLTTPWGGCPEGWPKDPCQDVQIAIHAPSIVRAQP
jgi:hypothetical protein